MIKRKNRFKRNSNPKNKSRLCPPFYINKNQQFDIVRKRMTMKTDGPTLNEMSSIDTTGNVGKEELTKPVTERPVSNSTIMRNWCAENSKEILIGIIVSLVVIFASKLIIEHGEHLVKHDKDIEVLQKNDDKQDESIEKIKTDANEIKTNARILEQRVDFSSNKSYNSGVVSKEK